MAHEILAIGGAAGFSGDRWDAAGPVADSLVARGGPAAIMFETLAERTLALAQLARRKDPAAGYEPALEKFLRPVLRRCVDHGIQIVGNFGAANPRGAAQHIRTLAREEGIPRLRIAVVEGDDLSDAAGKTMLSRYLDSGLADRAFVSANAYLGAKPIADALRAGAQVVVTGRVADPALALGPAMAWYDWPDNSWDTLARATMAGHLLECGAQVTGGYFADPGLKDVPRLHEVGFPIAEIGPDGSFTITKAAGTGGLVDTRTVKEQLLYEVHDPAAYVTPDVVADISMAALTEVGRDRVAVSGIRGHPRPDNLKVTVCFDGGWLGEGEISYAGPNAEARARLAADVVRRRVDPALRPRFDLIGVLSVFGDDDGEALREQLPRAAADVRLRVAAAHAERSRVEDLLHEVVALYTCGPAGGGGVRTSVTPRLASASCFVPRELVEPRFTMIE